MSKPEPVTLSPISFQILTEGSGTSLLVRHAAWPAEQPPMLCMSVATDLIEGPAAQAAFTKLVEEIGRHIHRVTFDDGTEPEGFVHVDASQPTH